MSNTTSAPRTHYKFRAPITGSDLISIKSDLERRLESLKDVSAIPSAKRLPHMAFTFTGQGTLFACPGKQLSTTVRSLREDFSRFIRIEQQYDYPSFLLLITFKSDKSMDTIVAHDAPVNVQRPPPLGITCCYPKSPYYFQSKRLPSSCCGYKTECKQYIFLVGTRTELLQPHCGKSSHCIMIVKAFLSAIEGAVSAS